MSDYTYYQDSNGQWYRDERTWFERDVDTPVGDFVSGLYNDGKDVIKTVHQDARDLVSGYGNTVQSIWTHGEDAAKGVGESLATPLVIVGAVLLGVLLLGEVRR